MAGAGADGSAPDWMVPFARTIDGAKKYVVSGTMDRVDWNAELVRGAWLPLELLNGGRQHLLRSPDLT